MSARDELAKDIDHILYTDSFYGDMFRNGQGRKTLIDAILAAGYRKPHIITTVEELNALPTGSVVLADGGKSWQKDPGVLPWQNHAFAFGATSEWIFAHRPVTVLYEPEASS